MNKTKIEWCGFTWNPISGCLNDCSYCYARKIYRRFHKSFKPMIHYDRLDQPVMHDKPSRIFTCSVSDLWGKGVPPIWRSEVWNMMYAAPQHTFITLTKQPQNIDPNEIPQLPENLWLGVTITGVNDEWRAKHIRNYTGIKFISFEPLLAKPLNIGNLIKGFDWIIVGAMTGKGSEEYKPQKGWIVDIMYYTRKYGIPLFMKNNLKRYLNDWLWFDFKLKQEFPKKEDCYGGV